MHHLLIRQLRRALAVDNDDTVKEMLDTLSSTDSGFLEQQGATILSALPQLLKRISDTYEQNERDVTLCNRSLQISTDELVAANATLRAEADIKQQAIDSLRRSASGILHALGKPELLDDQAGLSSLSSLMESLVAERQAADEELHQQKRALDQHAIVSITDADGKIVYANEKFCEISEYTAEELLGNPHSIIKSGVHRPEFFAGLWRTITAGKVWHGEVCNRSRSGKLYWVNATIVPILNEQKVPRNYIAIRTDITASKAMAEELKKAKNAAEAGSRAKSAFLANMSHEIRTPMNAVIGFTELALQDQTLTPETANHLKTIMRSAKALLGIINNILDISKLENAECTLETVCFNLPNLLADAMRTLEQQASEKGLRLNLEYGVTLPVRLTGDPHRLRQVLLNLVGNAIKFTMKGEVTLSVRQGDEPDLFLFAVKDTGIGMTPAQLARIFEPFSQADVSTTRTYGGTGLGTTISKQIVELMGGTIRAESEFGQGSVFYFTARFSEAAATEICLYETDEIVLEHGASPRQFRILLAEDIEVNAALAILRLEQEGHSIDWVKNGLEAVDAFRTNHYDIILMDVMMPEMDGLEATRTIRDLEAGTFSRIPILALTASVMHEESEKYYAVGMDCIEGKPVDFNRLFSSMEQIVPKGKGTLNDVIKINIEARGLFEFSSLDGIADYKAALKVWKDPTAYIKALSSFALLRMGDADQIERLLSEYPADTVTVREMAHSLRGVAANLAINQVANLAAEIEAALHSRQRETAVSRLGALRTALLEAVSAILNLGNPDDTIQAVTKTFDGEAVRYILCELAAALEELNPDVAEPVLAKLADYVAKPDLDPVRRLIDAFDFDAARAATFALADKLGISLE